MKHVQVVFKGCEQIEQELHTESEYMIAAVLFDLNVDGETYHDQRATVKQPVGGHYESGPLEVYRPDLYTGPLNYAPFRDIVEDYYRSLIGSQAQFIRVGTKAPLGLIRGNFFAYSKSYEFDVSDGDFTW